MAAYLIVLEITPMQDDGVYAELPLHCTVVYWFWAGVPVSRLVDGLQRVAERHCAIELHIGAREVFTTRTKQGEMPVHVNLVEKTPQLMQLHAALCKELDAIGAIYAGPRYVKDGFTPHVTWQHDGTLQVGQAVVSTALSLVTAAAPEYGNDRRVVCRVEWG